MENIIPIAHTRIISTHALTEGDLAFSLILSPIAIFQLTPSRRATALVGLLIFDILISTHALTEGDSFSIGPSMFS